VNALSVGTVRELPLLRAAVILAAVLLAACSLPGRASTAVGYLEGRATVGPLTPVERIGVPTPTPSPELCGGIGLTVLEADGTTEVARLQLRPDCTFAFALTPGSYIVRLRPGSNIQFSKDLPKTVKVERGETTRLEFSVDTGIR